MKAKQKNAKKYAFNLKVSKAVQNAEANLHTVRDANNRLRVRLQDSYQTEQDLREELVHWQDAFELAQYQRRMYFQMHSETSKQLLDFQSAAQERIDTVHRINTHLDTKLASAEKWRAGMTMLALGGWALLSLQVASKVAAL
jgi:hypothetical protein